MSFWRRLCVLIGLCPEEATRQVDERLRAARDDAVRAIEEDRETSRQGANVMGHLLEELRQDRQRRSTRS